MANFAALEARVNRAAAGHLANAEMVFDSATVAVVFERDDMQMPPAFGGQLKPGGSSRQRLLNLWRAGAPADDFLAAAPDIGTVAAINGTNYTVTQVDTDPTGWMTLTLRRVA